MSTIRKGSESLPAEQARSSIVEVFSHQTHHNEFMARCKTQAAAKVSFDSASTERLRYFHTFIADLTRFEKIHQSLHYAYQL